MSTFTNVFSQTFWPRAQAQSQPRQAPRPRSPPPPRLSRHSTPGVENSAWASRDFMLGAGMIIIQRNTHKVVVIYDSLHKYWFFPRGRKDVGESLEQTALREAYEESGYRAEFLPLYNPTRQPLAPHEREENNILNVEPIFMTLTSWQPRTRRNRGVRDDGGEYLTTWYVGEIPEDAVPEIGTGMPDEQSYRSYLFPFDEALQKVYGTELRVLRYAWDVYLDTARLYEEAQRLEDQPEHSGPNFCLEWSPRINCFPNSYRCYVRGV
ncbi:hypothetical protein GALMADRAFT_119291 [Galerina marginata CBS 339.88]|uniref:Nudix hydrolase domain-containing protein n=1 Tax=Galerina marginata (strain CBS 339.88) TaxID=685588 RepID=A0A067T7C9_GALM3|nr:hypothetical protein GALMADRAFT_119291 [Galerina marginata CBS 339.88]